MSSYFELLPRELETLELTSKGLSNKEIMDKMFIAKTTLTTYFYNIYSKLGISAGKGKSAEMRVKAVLWYLKNIKGLNIESEN